MATGIENTELVLVFQNKVILNISLLLEHTLSFKSLFKKKKHIKDLNEHMLSVQTKLNINSIC